MARAHPRCAAVARSRLWNRIGSPDGRVARIKANPLSGGSRLRRLVRGAGGGCTGYRAARNTHRCQICRLLTGPISRPGKKGCGRRPRRLARMRGWRGCARSRADATAFWKPSGSSARGLWTVDKIVLFRSRTGRGTAVLAMVPGMGIGHSTDTRKSARGESKTIGLSRPTGRAYKQHCALHDVRRDDRRTPRIPLLAPKPY